jgi:hypothetical protein
VYSWTGREKLSQKAELRLFCDHAAVLDAALGDRRTELLF